MRGGDVSVVGGTNGGKVPRTPDAIARPAGAAWSVPWPLACLALASWALFTTAGCAALPSTAPAVSGPQRVIRIGALTTGNPDLEPIWQALRELGYEEDRNLAIERRPVDSALPPDAQLAVGRELADELVNLKVDLILTSAEPSTLSAKEATARIPIVFVNQNAPRIVEVGFVASLARPGGNLTGVVPGFDRQPKSLELLKEAFPGISAVAVVWINETPNTVQTFESTERAADQLGIRIIRMEIRDWEELDRALDSAIRRGADAFMGRGRVIEFDRRERIAPLVAAKGLPAIYQTSAAAGAWADAGALMVFGESRSDRGRRTAAIIDKILRGANPAELPVELATGFDFVLNLRAARAQGFTFPQSTLLQATEVIQ